MLRLPAIATAVVVVAVLLYVGAGFAGAARKLAAVEPVPPRGDYAITLAFPPERFHQLRLQDQGRLVEVRAQTVYMKDVSAGALAEIARAYWVVSIARWSGA
jgi:hypothetical protein